MIGILCPLQVSSVLPCFISRGHNCSLYYLLCSPIVYLLLVSAEDMVESKASHGLLRSSPSLLSSSCSWSPMWPSPFWQRKIPSKIQPLLIGRTIRDLVSLLLYNRFILQFFQWVLPPFPRSWQNLSENPDTGQNEHHCRIDSQIHPFSPAFRQPNARGGASTLSLLKCVAFSSRYLGGLGVAVRMSLEGHSSKG